nr:MFS transporter [Cryobacterium sp. M91]
MGAATPPCHLDRVEDHLGAHLRCAPPAHDHPREHVHNEAHSPVAAGVVIELPQFLGAFGRIIVGSISDRLDSRVGVLRRVAISAAAVMLLLAAAGGLQWNAAAAIMLVIATTVSVADNGLAFTSVAEAAGPSETGRALGVQNTGQFIAA